MWEQARKLEQTVIASKLAVQQAEKDLRQETERKDVLNNKLQGEMKLQLRLERTAEPAREPTRPEKKALAGEKAVLLARIAEARRTVEEHTAAVTDSRTRLECLSKIEQIREEQIRAEQANAERVVSLTQLAAAGSEELTSKFRASTEQLGAENARIDAQNQIATQLRRQETELLSKCRLRELAIKHLRNQA